MLNLSENVYIVVYERLWFIFMTFLSDIMDRKITSGARNQVVF